MNIQSIKSIAGIRNAALSFYGKHFIIFSLVTASSLLSIVGLVLMSFTQSELVYATAPGSYTTCSGTFDDHAGTSNYFNNRNDTYVYCPDNGGDMVMTFNSFSTESNYDYLYVYDGDTT